MKWDEKRDVSDAPIWMNNKEASAWAEGYNTAVRNYIWELNEASTNERKI